MVMIRLAGRAMWRRSGRSRPLLTRSTSRASAGAPAPVTADYATAVRGGQAWAAVEDGQVAGFAVLIARPGYLLLDNIAVLPAAQRRGIGARLLGLAEQHARSLGLSEIRLYTNEAMTENLAYYARHGYAETHRAEQDGFRRVFFRKPID